MNDLTNIIKFCKKCNSSVLTTNGYCNECNEFLNIEEPNLLNKAINFTKASLGHIKNGCKKRSEEEINEIFKICRSCELYNIEDKCNICGCNLKLKISWVEQHCPINKW